MDKHIVGYGHLIPTVDMSFSFIFPSFRLSPPFLYMFGSVSSDLLYNCVVVCTIRLCKVLRALPRTAL